MNNVWNVIGVDDYEFSARYIPAFIFEIALLFSFRNCFDLSLDYLIKLNNIIPIAPFFILLLLVSSFPIKTIIRLLGELFEALIWKIKHPTILYLELKKKDVGDFDIVINSCQEKNRKLKDLLEDKAYHRFIIEALKKETRDDKKLRDKLKEYGFFRNALIVFILLSIIDYFFADDYFFIYLIFSVIFLVLFTLSGYYVYPKQLINSFIEKRL